MLPFCGAAVKIDSSGHHHDGAHKSGSCLDHRQTLIEVHSCTCVTKEWTFGRDLTALSTKKGASHAVVAVVLGAKAQMFEG
jgi:hypothetical protein